jgi:peptidase S41-like protein
VLHNLGRATLVGDRTAGAGHMVNMFDLPRGFVAGVSITRVSDPRTGREFEAVGVQPDVRVPPERALGVAHTMALRAQLAKTNDDARRRALEMRIEWLTARDSTIAIASDRIAAITGPYECDRSVRRVNGRLEYRRGNGMAEELVPLGGDRFGLAGEARVSFSAGTPAAMLVERADGTSSSYPRVAGTP